MQINKIENLTDKELLARADAIEPLGEWDNSLPTNEELFMQDLWLWFRNELAGRFDFAEAPF